MENLLWQLAEHVEHWRRLKVGDYWLHSRYLGSALHHLGEQDLTYTQDKLWHLRNNEWHALEKGSDFWLMSVPGTFVWARDLLTKVLPEMGADADAVEVRYNADFGFVEYLRVNVASRDAANFTYEVTSFGVGVHAEWK